MVTSIARQSVITKCNMQASIMLGNYEFYYGAGLFCKLAGVFVGEHVLPEELETLITPELMNYKGKDEKEDYLIKMLTAYKAEDKYDEQMKELLTWGLTEEHIWQM